MEILSAKCPEAAGQWEFITGTADTEARDYESKKQKAFY